MKTITKDKRKMKTRSQSILGMAFAMVVVSVLALTSANAALIINANFASSDPGSLVGPAGGSGETWNNSIAATVNVSTWSQTPLLDSTGDTTGIGYTMHNSGHGLTAQGSTTTLSMLRNAVYIGQDATTLTITGLNSASAYDIYIAGFSSNYPSGANFSTSNTTSTVGTQTYLSNAGDQSSAWVQGQNYVLFEDVVPDGSNTIVIDSTKVGYSFFSGFQVVETVPEPATLGLFVVFGGGFVFVRRRKGSILEGMT